MSKKPSETTIKTSIRIRPCSDREKEAYPGPNLVQAAPGEVRLYAKHAASVLNTASIGGRSSPYRETLGGRPRPGTPNRPGTPTHGASAAAQAAWQAVQQQALGGEYQSYPFANVFGPETGTVDVYNGSGCRDIVESVLGGCNGTIFVYGQTGAGKTYTMDAFTKLVLQQLYAAAGRDDTDSEITITISAVELYNEILRCLLSGRENLQLRMGAGGSSSTAAAGVVLEGADERVCHSCEEAAAVVETAKANRAVGETRANARSSRSHLIIRVQVEVLQLNSSLGGSDLSGAKAGAAAPASVSFSLLNLVDLAGSERIDKSGSSDTPLRLREALNINKSLLCLGNVVTALAERSEGKKSVHIPYRDSKLTRLLEDSLGGNAVTALLACVTPLPEWHMEQTRATLEFAARAARVVCSPQRNVLKLLPDAPGADSSALIAALQAEITELKQLLAQHKEGGSIQPAAAGAGHSRLQSAGKTLQSRPWDSCSSTSTEMAEAAAAAEASLSRNTAADEAANVRSRLSSGGGWTSRMRLSISSSSKAAVVAATAAAGAESTAGPPASGDTEATAPAAVDESEVAPRQRQQQQAAGADTPPRTSNSSNSLLWKFFNARGSSGDSRLQGSAADSLQSGLPPAGLQSGNHSSLRSAGLLMLASSSTSPASKNASSGGKGSSSDDSSQQQQQQQAGMLTRWATFHNGRILRPSSDGGWHTRNGSSSSSSKYGLITAEQQQQQDHPGAEGSAEGMQQTGQIVAAGAAAMALRDHIIKQLVTALQQKKAEIKQLREQQAVLQQQLEAAQQEGAASKQKLRELAEGIQALAGAREEEFERWKGHLEELEVALQAAQQESLTYRQEALALVHQLTQLQSRYRSLQSDQLRRSTIIQSANQNMLLQSSNNTHSTDMVPSASDAAASVQQTAQLANCITSLLGIEECLRQLLTQSTAPKTMTGSAAATPRSANSPVGGVSTNGLADIAGQLQSPKLATPGDVSSHVIQTLSTRYDMTSGLITKAPPPNTAVQLEPVLQQLQGLIPLIKAAAAAAPAAGTASPRSSLSMQRKGSGLAGMQSEGDSSSNPASPRLPSSITASPGPDSRPESPNKCRKCESIKPLLAIMQKLKDEVSNLKAALKARDEQLAAATTSSAAAKRDLEESRQQVGALQERIDELAEELEQARAAAAVAAAAKAAATGQPPSSLRAVTDSPSSAAAGAASHSQQQQVSDAGSLGAALSCRGSRSDHDTVPLMSDDTPLQELHAQILLSWHALAMPCSHRTGFVLGHGSSAAAATVPWLDRQQCQAHIALLACLHQLQEDNPAAAAVQQLLLQQEAALLETGLARLDQQKFDALCVQWNVSESLDVSLQRQALLQQLWQPCSAAAAGRMAAASAEACEACFSHAPAMELAGLMLACNSAVMAATSNALADAAS